MHIKVALRHHPFSHVPGVQCVLPGSRLSIQVYPTRIYVKDLSEKSDQRLVATVCYDVSEIVEKFTVFQNLEKGWVEVSGEVQKKYFRYRLVAFQNQEGLAIIPLKGEMTWKQVGEKSWTLSINPSFLCLSPQPLTELPPLYRSPKLDRLSLGNHKKQDWSLVDRRLDLAEILPVWLRLGQELKKDEKKIEGGDGTLGLLQKLKRTIEERRIEEVPKSILDLYRTGFSGILTPRLQDEDYLGLPLSVPAQGSPLILLQEGARLIRSLFVQTSTDMISLLPVLPIPLHCGRYIGVQCDELATVDIEWTKKQLRRVIIHPQATKTISLVLPKPIRSYRVRKGYRDRGEIKKITDPLIIEKDQILWLDHFFV